MEGLKFITSLTWDDVFEIWRKGEEHLPHWKPHYESRGFSSWKDWRMSSAQRLKPETLKWELFELTDPSASIPSFRGGPFKGWIRDTYHGVDKPRFSEIMKDQVRRDQIIRSGFIENFPAETTITGLCVGDEIVVIEGMHRCCAVTLAAEQGHPIHSRILIVLATYPSLDIPLLGHDLPKNENARH